MQEHQPYEFKVMCRELQRQDESLREATELYGAVGPDVPHVRAADFYVGPKDRRPFQRKILGEGTWLVQLLGEVILDQIRGLTSLLHGDRHHFWSPMLLSRAAIEAASRACYLWDPEGGARERALRTSAMLLDMSEEQRVLAREHRPREIEVAEKGHEKVVARAKRAGYVFDPPEGRIRRLKYEEDSKWRQVKVNTTELANRYVPDAADAYSLGSAATHSSIWMVVQSTADPVKGQAPQLQLNLDMVGIAVNGVIESGAALSIALAEMRLGDSSPYRRRASSSTSRVYDVIASSSNRLDRVRRNVADE